jgi:hypothetical protein
VHLFLRIYIHIYLQQESNPLKRNLEFTSSTSHDQELMEEKNEVEPRRSKRTKT